MVNKRPSKCNLCSGDVVLVSNAKIYGKEYGSGRCYLCKKCGAYVGTHKPKPDEALGLLADNEMRELKVKCHELFDIKWSNKSSGRQRHNARKLAYKWLADKLNINYSECHFGYFNKEMLYKVLDILRSDEQDK